MKLFAGQLKPPARRSAAVRYYNWFLMSVPFKKGDRVIYPHHGAAKVEKREKVVVGGQTREFLILRTLHQESNMDIQLPLESVAKVGIRWPASESDVADLLDMLRERDIREAGNWSRRFKNHQENLRSGEPFQLAETVRNLWLRDMEKSKGEGGGKGLSPAERKLINKAMGLLVSEISLSLKTKPAQAKKKIEEALAGREAAG